MCTFREIWIPPIILPISMTSDYVTVSIRSCPEFGDADYIIVWKFSGRSVSCFKDMDRGFLESPTPYQSGKPKKKKKRLNTGPKEGGCDGCAHFPHRLQRSTFFTSVHLFVDQLFKTKGINTIFIRIHWMCSKIENTVKELTSPLTLSTKYILTFLWKYKKGNLVIAYKAFFSLATTPSFCP